MNHMTLVVYNYTTFDILVQMSEQTNQNRVKTLQTCTNKIPEIYCTPSPANEKHFLTAISAVEWQVKVFHQAC